MTDPSTPAQDPGRPRWLGPAAFGLGLVSTVVYYASSQGIRHFATFAVDAFSKALKAFGHGA